MLMDEERDLVEKSRLGDPDAFERLVLEHQKQMLNIAYRMTGSYDDACDIVQEVFISAYRHIGSFEGRSRFSTWLCSITVNLAKNRLKQQTSEYAQKTTPLGTSDDHEDGCFHAEPASPEPSALDCLERHAVQQSVQDCIGTLAPDFRDVVVLRDIQGFSYREIGDMLGIAEGTVRSRLFRARDILRKCLVRKLGAL